MTALEPAPSTALALDDLADQARTYIGASKAPSTVRRLRTDWQAFATWCAERGMDALPASPDTVAMYVTDLAAYFPASGAFHERFAGAGIPVAATLLQVAGLAYPELMVEVEVTAQR